MAAESDKMLAVCWEGKEKMVVREVPRPHLKEPTDVVIKVTSTCICGSDLHIYENVIPGMEPGDIMGHEFMGIVEEVGSDVKNSKKGDRAVVCFDIGCGKCFYCQRGLYSCCSVTNPSQMVCPLYGHKIGGFFGYSHITGGYPGGQAQYARVPFADVNLLKIPSNLPDKKVILLSDILPTAWHANELAGVGKGDRVAIWGAGPVGQLAAHCAFVRGADRVIIIDDVEYRLQYAKDHMPKIETIKFDKVKVPEELHKKFGTTTAPDVGIEAVGVHYAKSWVSKLEMATGLATDPSDMLNEIIYSVRKGGRIGVVGVYVGYTNHFNIGGFMEKGMSMAAGQTPCQKYWPHLLKLVQEGTLTPDMVITHELPLTKAPEGYEIFNKKEEHCVKVVMHPWEGLGT
ncbi:hypothetical protein WJX75_004550 [Coccomyxa subellipsoidea]|uniref:Alcohol dehydrogenase-like N-terminal domain-containing protein n=1 Tax=Coccomyxa subellipsoidea TaxID=248742 RepID=A0ABR2YMH4_9CHLO